MFSEGGPGVLGPLRILILDISKRLYVPGFDLHDDSDHYTERQRLDEKRHPGHESMPPLFSPVEQLRQDITQRHQAKKQTAKLCKTAGARKALQSAKIREKGSPEVAISYPGTESNLGRRGET